MARVLVFDTETTGLWKFKLPFDHPTQPEAVQLAAKLINTENGQILGQINFIVKSNEQCEAEAAAIHGITQDLIDSAGVPRRIAIASFHHLLKAADVTVAHNWDFDSKIISRTYFLENSSIELFKQTMSFCTMKASTEICRLPGKIKGKFKWPSLQEAYRLLVNPAGFEGAHDAMVDVEACLQVYLKLREVYNEPEAVSA